MKAALKALESCAEYQITAKKTGNTVGRKQFLNSTDSSEFARSLYGSDISIYESFWLICLARNNKPKAFYKIGQGGIDACIVDIKLIAKACIESLSSSVILVHNHPSGSLKPSNADIQMTNKAKEALKLFDIVVLDHVIVTEDGYFSFSDECIL